MGNIQVLDELTIDKIAAGEVIERPASVVKELVENAIDSQANAITVEIKDGGTSLIRITDNGCGIESQDVPTAFLRHATSKIRTAVDLLSIHSLGFRGEALSSIAAVAQVELITKTSQSMTGVRYLIAGGKETSIEHIGCPEGTTFLVRNLFFNVPARQKFLKSAQTEGAHIYDLIQQLALSHPEISFQFIMNGQNRFHTSGNGNIKDIIYSIYGRDVAKGLLPITFERDLYGLQVTGFVGKPIISRGNRSFENYYINHRYIKSKVICKAVEDAYKNFTMVHKFPFVCLCFDIFPEEIDVNVHPQKMELRFHHERELYDVIKSEIRKVLLNQDLIPDVSLEKEKKVSISRVDKQVGAQPFEVRRKSMEQAEQKGVLQEEVPIFTATKQQNTKITTASIEVEKPLADTNSKNNQIPMVKANVSKTKPFVNCKNEQVSMTQVEDKSFNAKMTVKEKLENQQMVNSQPVVTERDTFVNKQVADIQVEQIKNEESSNDDDSIKQKSTLKTNEPENATALKSKAVNEQLSFTQPEFLDKAARPDHRIIGQLFKTYWLIEYDNKLFIMDQHAAHEKVNYERFMKHYKNREKRYIQQVAPPIVISLSPKEALVYEEYKDYFADFGFEIEHFGGNEYTIHGVPTDLYGIADQDAFLELLDEIVENVHGTNTTMIADKIATMACKASVKGNQKLSFEEAQKLIDELMTLDSPFTCPHGRPTIISMSKMEIEKKFKRIQD